MTTTTPRVHITPEHTYCAFIDALPCLCDWGSFLGEQVTGGTSVHDDPVSAWEATIREDRRGAAPVRVGHDQMIDAMRRIVAETDSIRSAAHIVDTVRDALNAENEETAGDALCQLDVFGFDVIVQVAALGHADHS